MWKAFQQQKVVDVEELASLVIRARAGDLHAYGEIFRRFQDMAYGYAYSLLGDFHLAEDAAQEAFIEAYRHLAQLREPAAFPGWFRRIVFKHCDRIRRGRKVATAPLEAGANVPSGMPDPADAAEKAELKDAVLAAIRSLAENERTVTTLFYINGYTQNDIADFLEVPVTTVKNRLYTSRKRLKERMIGMVAEELKKSATDERFSKAVIEKLLARPKPLEIEGHPVREVWDAIRAALPEYEVIRSSEIETRDALAFVGEDTYRTYWVDDNRALRTQMTVTTFSAMGGRTPPVRILAAGRVFRQAGEDETHSKVFHQVDGLCIEPAAGLNDPKATVEKCLHGAFEAVETRWEANDIFPFVAQGQEVFIRFEGDWLNVAGCGLLKPESLREAGYDPEEVSGYAFGLGLERLAMLKFDIDDIRKLWQPPYVPEAGK